MSGKDDWEAICQQVQNRQWEITPHHVKNARMLWAKILKCLTTAHNEGALKTKIHEIHSLLKLEKSAKNGKGFFEIVGGQRNFKRRKNIPHFERRDGCWFDFAISIDQNSKPAEIIGFDFEIRFPENYPVKFLRFDLNLPNHNNENRGMRFHIHPGSDDFTIHSPPMSPFEILHLFLYGLEIPERPRSS
ncbi:hypothetical protein IQ249_24145 [Lusitaniella coriacea LEGE 07157]|uniref:Uncharacterized protein n=1 Tax=Lusitaniella coriacea LEGE 07157 TaxID=945747 RepID=A0A8J7E053_9CYAN|nr:hypothetical protein [Lusitaniella coriacea]MBE9118986.1 hypothetical protein [Lusitaniella coriacea LEGE 07157]